MLDAIGNTSQMLSQLFSRLDSKHQGYLEKSDFASAFSQITANNGNSSSSNVDDVFSALDTDSDGKVTENEFSTTLSQLLEQLNSQFNQSRLQGPEGQGGPQGMSGNRPPPPPPGNDSGFSKDELQSQLKEIGNTDSQRGKLISNIVNNFDAADSNSDGKVSFSEAMAYEQSSQSSASTTSTSGSDSSSGTSSSASSISDAQVMMKIMELMQAYGNQGQHPPHAGASSLLSTTA